MYKTCLSAFPTADIAVMSAAVADYQPLNVAGKNKEKRMRKWLFNLLKQRDILKSLGEIKQANQLLVGLPWKLKMNGNMLWKK